MPTTAPLLCVLPLLLHLGEPENVWKSKVPAAVARAEREGSVPALADALDVAWRADDWAAGAKLADLTLKRHPQEPALAGLAMRALWRAGRLKDAEALIERIPTDTRDRVALRTLVAMHLARCDRSAAGAAARRLEALGPESAEDYFALFACRLDADELKGLDALLRRAERATDPKNGYPETLLGESIAGVADFLTAVGPTPLNQIAAYGAAPMPPLVMFNLPSCDVLINGQGPYRVVVDTGGSILLAVDTAVAEEIGLKSLGKASVRGVSGKSDSEQVLVDELRLGTITCRRVLTRVFDVRSAIMGAADGIIGTGLFARGRVILDFATPQLIVEPSSAAPGRGQPVDLRIIGDAKLIVPVTLQGGPALALLDTGADAVAFAPATLARLFPGKPIPKTQVGIGIGVGSGGNPVVSLPTDSVTLELAGRRFPNYGGVGLDVLDALLSPIVGTQLDLLLGMPLFREMRSCTIDLRRGNLWIEWLPHD